MTAGVLDAVLWLSALRGEPVATTYLHNDCFPDDAMAVALLGCQGHEAMMKCVYEVDCIVVGSRMNPLRTLRLRSSNRDFAQVLHAVQARGWRAATTASGPTPTCWPAW